MENPALRLQQILIHTWKKQAKLTNDKMLLKGKLTFYLAQINDLRYLCKQNYVDCEYNGLMLTTIPIKMFKNTFKLITSYLAAIVLIPIALICKIFRK